jgi:hypothetical protein
MLKAGNVQFADKVSPDQVKYKMLIFLITCRFGFTFVPKKICIRKNEFATPPPQTIVLNIQTVA